MKSKPFRQELTKEILTTQESRHSIRPDVYYFWPTTHSSNGEHLPTYISYPAFCMTKALNAIAATKALPKSEFYQTFYVISTFNFLSN